MQHSMGSSWLASGLQNFLCIKSLKFFFFFSPEVLFGWIRDGVYIALDSGRNLSKIDRHLLRPGAFQVAEVVKKSPCIAEDQGLILGWEDTLEKGMATHSSILAWRIPMDRGAWWAKDHWVTKRRHDWVTKHSFTKTYKKEKIPLVFLLYHPHYPQNILFLLLLSLFFKATIWPQLGSYNWI